MGTAWCTAATVRESVIIDDAALAASASSPISPRCTILPISPASRPRARCSRRAPLRDHGYRLAPDHAGTAFIYALPYHWYENYRVRRYGFHGTSFLYVSKRAAVLLGKDPLPRTSSASISATAPARTR